MPDNQEYILVFCVNYFPFVGGAEVAIRDITKRLPHYHFDIVTTRMNLNLPKTEVSGNVTIHRIGCGVPFVDKLFLAFYGPVYAAEFAHIHSYKLVWGMMASFSGLAASRFKHYLPNIPYLLTLQEGEPEVVEKKGKFLGGRFRKIFTTADEVQVISHYLMSWAYKMGVKGEVRLVPNGVDLSLFTPRPKIKLSFKTIITTSRLVYKNGVDTLIKAMPLLPSHFRLTILGDGPQRLMLENLATALGVEDRVDFMGTLPHEQMITYLNQADVFCRASRSEGLGNSFLEAMALNLPCVGTRVGGIADFLIDNETGFVCAVDNPESVARTLKKVLDDGNAELVKKVTTKARQMIESKYAIDVVVEKMGKIFANIKVRR